MPRLVPLSHKKLINKLKKLGFVGPKFEGRHAHMIRGTTVIPIPIHGGKGIGVGLISAIIKQVGVSRQEWIDL